MATVTKTPSGTWKAIIRKVGWPTASKTFRTKRDAEDWARRTEDEMVRGVFIQRAASERLVVLPGVFHFRCCAAQHLPASTPGIADLLQPLEHAAVRVSREHLLQPIHAAHQANRAVGPGSKVGRIG